MSKNELSEEDMRAHEEFVGQSNEEYAASITPDYIAGQHALQSELLGKGVDLSLKAATKA